MSNIILACPTISDKAALTGSTTAASLPLGNLKTTPIGHVTRFTTPNSAYVQADFGAPTNPVDLIALIGHNASIHGKVRVKAGNTPDVVEYDSGELNMHSDIEQPVPLARFKALPEIQPDLTFARSTSATRINVQGLLSTVSANVLRHQYDPITGEYLGWLTERSQTNLIADPNDFSVSYTKANNVTLTPDDAIGPDGQMSMTKAEKTASAFQWVQFARTGTTSGNLNSFGIFMKAGTLTTTTILVTQSNTGNVIAQSNVNLTNGAVTVISGVPVKTKYYGNGIWRVYIEGAVSADTTTRFLVYVGQNNQSTAGDVYISHGMCVADSYLSSFIGAVTAATRAADQLSYTLPEAVTEGTIYFEGMSLDPAPQNSNNGVLFDLSDGTGTNARVSVEKLNSGITRLSTRMSGIAYPSNTVNIPINTPFRAALSFKDGQLFGSINGVPVTFASMPSTINPMSILRIGSYGNGANVNNGMIWRDGGVYPVVDQQTANDWSLNGLPDDPVIQGKGNFILKLPEDKTYRYWRIEFSDPSSPYIDIGRLYISKAFQPKTNIDYGEGQGFIDPSNLARVVSGRVIPNERKKRRTAEFALSFGSKEEMYGAAYDIDNWRGTTRDVLYVYNYDDKAFLNKRTIYGLMAELAPIVNANFQLFEKRYRIEEIVA